MRRTSEMCWKAHADVADESRAAGRDDHARRRYLTHAVQHMHILFLSDNFPPEMGAGAARTFEHAKRWVRAGHRVTVICAVPNFPEGKLFQGWSNRFQRDCIAGV